MCGIVGAVGPAGAGRPLRAPAALDALAHRGPDSVGEWSGRDAWLGFRRLSILDLRAAADQPMVDEASGVALVFNGEIYNYRELRTELEAAGHRFRTTGDTEVLLRGYLQWGTALFARCNGMWAVGIADPAHPGVLLCRDRFGEKPLHVGADADGRWWFGSELRTLRSVGAGTDRLHLGRALGFLVLGDVEDPLGSYVAGIEQVGPGTCVRLTEAGLGRPTTWWDTAAVVAAAAQGAPGSPEEVLDALDRSVALRLRADVEVGTSLSGGVDSSAVVASIRAVDPGRVVHAFTASFPGRSIDEYDRAALVAARSDITLHRVEPTVAGFAADLDRLVERQGAPIESPTVYAQWCVMRAAHETGVTVLLDGQGADETWGGYPKHAGFGLLGHALGGRLGTGARAVRTWRSLGAVPRPPLGQAAGLLVPGPVGAGLRRVATRLAADGLGPAFAGVRLADPQGPGRQGPLLRRAATADLSRVLLPRLLRYADRNSMAWSREVRLPYLDPELVDLGLRSRWGAGLDEGWTKLALRRAVEGRVPAEVLWRREKVAYETPDTEWLAHPDVAGQVVEAQRHLADLGLRAEGASPDLHPWRVLSLSRFVAGYGLRS